MSDGSFESSSRSQQKHETCDIPRWPYRKIQPAVEKAIKILHIDLDRLDRHRKNIVKFQVLEDWPSLNKENINSSRTVQQLKSNIQQLEQIRQQVAEHEVAVFDAKVADIQRKAVASVEDFLQPQCVDEASSDLSQVFSGPSSLPVSVPVPADYDNSHRLSERKFDTMLMQEQIEISRSNAQAEQSWSDLKENLEELNGLIHDYSTLVQDQQTAVDSIEDNVEKAQVNVSEGITHLVTANKLKAAAFPVAGALLGTVVGGPLGLVIGIKAGLAAAGVGSVIGFTSGSFLKKRQAKKLDIELSNLSKEKSQSLPDLSNCDERVALQTSYHEDT